MTKILYTKPFFSHREQLESLKSRGMKFADEDKALHLLKNIGYYRFSGYWYPLLANKQQPVFKPGATFELAFSLYKFDRELRKLIIAELEKIEVAVRTQMAYAQWVSLSIGRTNLFGNNNKPIHLSINQNKEPHSFLYRYPFILFFQAKSCFLEG